MEQITELFVAYASRALLALIVLWLGWNVIRRFTRWVTKRMAQAGVDPGLQSFSGPLIRVGLQILLAISVASMLGAEMTSFIAVIGAAGFAVGLALQGSLSNFAGGVLILLLKPFRVGDYIEAAGYGGTVKEIQVFYTILNTPDNRKIIVPNAQLSNNSMVNYSVYDTRRIDFKFGVGYGDDAGKVKEILRRIAAEHPLIHQDPAPMVVLGEHGDSAVVFYFRVWCNASDYWTLYFELLESVKEAFDEAGINIPYPQMDVHMITDSTQ